jgi:Fe2+ or Zn2+ uptake regulation protein
VSYQKIKAIIENSQETGSLQELISKLEEDPAFFYGKRKKVLIRRQRKQYIDRCVKLGLLDENYKLTTLGYNALKDFDSVLSQIIFDLDVDGKKFKEILLETLANVDIPTVERIYEKMQELSVEMPTQQLRNYLNILAKCGVLQKTRKYTYTLKQLEVTDFEAILKKEYQTAEKDPSGTIWFEQYKETIQKKYNLTASQFNELLAELRKRKPGLISTQRARTKTWFRIREV